MNETKSKSISTKQLVEELKNNLTALHYMGLARRTNSFSLYCTYGENVTKFIREHRLDIICYIDSWVNPQWQSSESVYCEFFRLYNEGEEIEALRTLNIK